MANYAVQPPTWGDPAFNPWSDYGARQNPKGFRYGPGEYFNTDTGQMQAHDQGQWDANYARQIAQSGHDTTSNLGQFLLRQSPRMLLGYREALLTNPLLKPEDHFRNAITGLIDQFSRLNPDQQGLNYARYAPIGKEIARGF